MAWLDSLDNYPLPATFQEDCQRYATLLLTYNKTHNISGAKTREAVEDNLLDSIYPLLFIKTWPATCVDIGSGAGLPAIPLALALPQTHFTLFEPIAKKSAFLHLAKSELGLSNVTVKTQRIEKAEPFTCGLLCSRAVTDAKALIALAKAFVGPTTQALLYKGSRADVEMEGFSNYTVFERGQRRYVLAKDLV